MTNFVLLNSEEHRDLRVITERGAQFGDAVMYALTFPFEFRNVQHCYPILFHRDKDGNRFPVALFGFQEGENLFLNGSKWDASYIPAMMQREPFLIGYQEKTGVSDADKLRVLSLDLDNPRVSTEKGEALFEPLGGNTAFLNRAADLLERLYQGIDHCKRFTQALEQHGLLESVTIEITLEDESANQLLGFETIAEEKVDTLDDAVLGEFARQQFLMPLFMVLASLSNIESLITRKNARNN